VAFSPTLKPSDRQAPNAPRSKLSFKNARAGRALHHPNVEETEPCEPRFDDLADA